MNSHSQLNNTTKPVAAKTFKDVRLLALYNRHGWLGIGVYGGIVCRLKNDSLDASLQYANISKEFKVRTDLIASIVEDFDLFEVHGKGSFSVKTKTLRKTAKPKPSKAVIEPVIPTKEEFIDHCQRYLGSRYRGLELAIKDKYAAWVENGWKKERNGKLIPILNWKATIRNTFEYLNASHPSQRKTIQPKIG